MLEVIFVILILGLAALAFNIQNSFSIRSKRERIRKDTAERNLRPKPEQRTVDLIGEEAFDEMTRKIDTILSKHSHQQCVTVNLSSGPDTREGASELHSILPGTPVLLNANYEGGVSWIDVYANGARIGRLALLDAATVKDVMKSNVITGTYVAEQNCYGIENSYQLAVIIFYEPKDVAVSKKSRFSMPVPHESRAAGSMIDICQN